MRKDVLTVLFMVTITVFFISVLAFVNEVSRERIAQNSEIQRVRSILYAFNIFPEGISEEELSSTSTTADIPWEEKQLLETMRNRVRRVRLPIPEGERELLKGSLLTFQDSVDVYISLNERREPIAYGFPLRGKGLWGTISAFGVVSSDFNRMIGIDFTEQVETPGLGARITEREFKYFFRNLDLRGFLSGTQDQPVVVMVGKKNQTNVERATNSVQAITGATQTCNGVLNMVNTDLRFYIRLLSENREVLNRTLVLEDWE